MAPRLIPKKLGRNAIVSATLNYIRPTSHWCEIYPNDYRQKRLQFKVEGLEQDPSGKNVLQLTHATYPNRIFTAFVVSVKLERPGPPKQRFINDSQPQLEEQTVQGPEDFVEEDPEPVEDSAIEGSANGEISAPEGATMAQDHSTNPTSDGDWNWTAFFDTIANDARGAATKNSAGLKHFVNTQLLRDWGPFDYFSYFMPWSYIRRHVITATSEALKQLNKVETTMHEFQVWLGIWFLMSLHQQYLVKEFFDMDAGKKGMTSGIHHNVANI